MSSRTFRFVMLIASLVLLPLFIGARLSPALRPPRIIFLHHSCGHNLIEQGGVREGLTALGYEFYDHGYNGDGLRLADGSYSGTDFAVPDDNTDPDGLAYIFSQPLHAPPDNTFSYLMQYDVIAFKSCFPVSNIGDDAQLAEYKSYYRAIRERMDRYPDKLFIIVTQPPQVPANSTPEEAARARAFTLWLQSDEFLAGHPNLSVFDFFGLLAGDDNFLRPEYRADEYDAHPNERANREIGPLFVSFFDETIRGYRGEGGPQPAPSPEPTGPPETEESPRPTTPLVAGNGGIDDFESPAAIWEADAANGSSIECRPDEGLSHNGASALRIQYTIAPDGWADCGRHFDVLRDWSTGAGLTLFISHQGTARQMYLLLFSGDLDSPTPFVSPLSLPAAEEWQQIVIPWDAFEKAEWADEGVLAEPDLSHITGYGISLEVEEGAEGTLWLDDLDLAVVVEPTPATGATAPAPEASESTAEPEEGREAKGKSGLCAAAFLLPPAALLLPVLKCKFGERECPRSRLLD